MKIIVAALVLFSSILFVSPFVTAQQSPAPSTAILSDDTNIDPTIDTDNPTLLKAQIMILQNAREAKRIVLAPLSDFQDFMRFDAAASQKQQKLNTIIQSRAQQATHATTDVKDKQKANFDAEVEALAKANREKAAAVTKK